MQRVDPKVQPSRVEIIEVLRIGLIASLLGLFLAFIASEISLVSLVVTAISRSQAVAIYEREQVNQNCGFAVNFGRVRYFGAHFFGSANSLGLLSWISKEEV